MKMISTMGVSQNNGNLYGAICELTPDIGNYLFNTEYLFNGKLNNWTDIKSKMDEFNVVRCVINPYPMALEAKRFRQHNGNVWLCYFTDDVGKEIWDKEKRDVFFDRKRDDFIIPDIVHTEKPTFFQCVAHLKEAKHVFNIL